MLWITRPGLSTKRVRNHRIVLGVGVLLDVEVLLNLPVRVGEECPLRANRRSELLKRVVVVGGNCRDLRVCHSDLRVERGEALDAAGAPLGSNGRVRA